METGIGPLDFGKSSVLDLARLVSFRAPAELMVRVSRAGLLVFVGFTLGSATHGKSDIEKIYDRVNARSAALVQAAQEEYQQTGGIVREHATKHARVDDNAKPAGP